MTIEETLPKWRAALTLVVVILGAPLQVVWLGMRVYAEEAPVVLRTAERAVEAIVAGHDPMSAVLLRLYRQAGNLLVAPAFPLVAVLLATNCTDTVTAKCPPLTHPPVLAVAAADNPCEERGDGGAARAAGRPDVATRSGRASC